MTGSERPAPDRRSEPRVKDSPRPMETAGERESLGRRFESYRAHHFPPVHSGHMGRRFMPSISAEGVFGALESTRLVIQEAEGGLPEELTSDIPGR